MLHLEPSTKKEIKNIGLGCLALGAAEVAVAAVLAAFGLLAFDYTVPLGVAGGAAVATLNFAWLACSVQRAVNSGDPKAAKATVQAGYGKRFLFQCIWCIAALEIPCFNGICGIIPLLFPRLIIFFMQITGYYKRSAGEGGEG